MTSGSILRGSLRPGGGRTPPFLIIGLLVICGILGFNYWNLSSEYDTLVKEIGELQDKFRIVALKREHAEKQSEAVERRFNEAEAEIGKIKISVFQKDQELTKAGSKIERQNDELEKLRDQITACQALNVQINSSKDKLEDLRRKLDESNTEKLQLEGEKQKLITERQDMRLRLEELTFKLAHFTQQRGGPLRPEQQVPQVPGKTIQEEAVAQPIHPAADDNKDVQGNNDYIQQANNHEQVQNGEHGQDVFQQNGKDKNEMSDKDALNLQHQENANNKDKNEPSNKVAPDLQHQEPPLNNAVIQTHGSEHNSVPRKATIVTGNTDAFANGNAQNNEVKSDITLQEGRKNSSLQKRLTIENALPGVNENNDATMNGNDQKSKLDVDGGGSNLETNLVNGEMPKPIELPSNDSIHISNDQQDQMQAGRHEDVVQVQTEGPEMIHGHKFGDSLDDPNMINQAEMEGDDKKPKETLQVYDQAFVKDGNVLKDAVRNNAETNEEDPQQPVRKFRASDEPTTNHENELANTNLGATVKEPENAADVDYPLNKPPVPAVGQENLSGNGVGLGGGEDLQQSMHAIPHAKDNGDYVDSKNVGAGLRIPKPSDEKEGEDNDIPPDRMKDTLKLPPEHEIVQQDSAINNKLNHRHNIPANIPIVGKAARHSGLFPPFRNEGTLGQEQMQS